MCFHSILLLILLGLKLFERNVIKICSKMRKKFLRGIFLLFFGQTLAIFFFYGTFGYHKSAIKEKDS